MRIKKEELLLYAVTNGKEQGKALIEQIREALDGGITLLQLREKGISEEDFVKKAKEILPLCKEKGVKLIINDSVMVAKKSGADGVHLGLEDGGIKEAREILGEAAIIGATAHNLKEALEAEKEGADYLGSGAAFGSLTKADAKPIDLNEYNKITEVVKIPVVAIGGIELDNVSELYGRGLAGVAVVSGIFSEEVSLKTKKLKDKLLKEFYQ